MSSVPIHVAAPSLTVAGLAAWVFSDAGLAADAERCGMIQEVIDAALQRGEHEFVIIPSPILEEAATLWEAGGGGGGPARPRIAGRSRQARRLEESVRLYGCGPSGSEACWMPNRCPRRADIPHIAIGLRSDRAWEMSATNRSGCPTTSDRVNRRTRYPAFINRF